ncbi:hypothetical protein X975_20611, partial [Stegodyphus mimosarum]
MSSMRDFKFLISVWKPDISKRRNLSKFFNRFFSSFSCSVSEAFLDSNDCNVSLKFSLSLAKVEVALSA